MKENDDKLVPQIHSLTCRIIRPGRCPGASLRATTQASPWSVSLDPVDENPEYTAPSHRLMEANCRCWDIGR